MLAPKHAPLERSPYLGPSEIHAITSHHLGSCPSDPKAGNLVGLEQPGHSKNGILPCLKVVICALEIDRAGWLWLLCGT